MSRPVKKKVPPAFENWMQNVAVSIDNLAAAINRLAATQEVPQNRSKMSTWGTASFDQTDPQTRSFRALEVERERIGNRGATQAVANRRS